MDPTLVYQVSEEAQAGCSKNALLSVDDNSMLLEPVKNQFEVLQVFLLAVTGDQEVIDVGVGEVEASQDLIDEPLKGLCRVLQSEGHPSELEQAERCDDGCFWDVLLVNWYLVVGPDQVYLLEYLGST